MAGQVTQRMPAESTVWGVLLAAGASQRFGADPPKQLWPMEGEPLVRRIARRAIGSRLAEVVVVVGHQADRVTAALAGLPVRIIENKAHRVGQASSVRAGLEAVGSEASGILFMPTDQPYLDVDLIDDLIGLFETTGGPIVVPTFGGSRGAPVLFSRSLFPELERLEGDAGGRQLFPLHADGIVELPLANSAPLQDVDTPDDRQRCGF
jgi:molybdenum cofactor cytidylyltransferase